MIETAKIVEILPTSIWVESDMMGSKHIMMQHQGHGEPFQYASFFYDYAYTSNSTMHQTVVEMMQEFGVAETDIVWKQREFKIDEEELSVYNSIEKNVVEMCAQFLKDTLDDHFAAEQLLEHFGDSE
jgi:hypothetical protein